MAEFEMKQAVFFFPKMSHKLVSRDRYVGDAKMLYDSSFQQIPQIWPLLDIFSLLYRV